MNVFTLEAFAVAFAAFEVAWLLGIPLWQTRLPGGRWLAGVGVLWIAVGALAAHRGYFRAVSDTFPPVVAVAGAVGFFLALVVTTFVPAVATASRAAGARTLVAVHVFRAIVGASFLSMASKAQLGPTMGYWGGVAEVLTGTLALALLVAMPRLDADRRRRWVLAWSALSLVTLALTAATWLLSLPSQWQRFGESALAARMADFPYAVLPTFVWPALLLTLVGVVARDDRF
jgi:hypothetical protein